ncbi:MAG: HAMP domain-containing histidine kinase [Pirellulaceae bacterium]|jgi:signal transduction histidine kinase|nr:HAMP domain-containing histidine kinase [Pirellulaceae bacterium]
MSAQLSYTSTGLAHGRGLGMKMTDAELAQDAAVRTQYVWQTLVLRSGTQNESPSNASECGSTVSSDGGTYVRFDTPHKAAPSPWMLAQWSEDFGWHRSLEPIAACQSPWAAQEVLHGSAAAQINLHTQPASDRPGSFTTASDSLAAEHAHLSQMLAEAAHDIRSPIAVAQQILSTVSQRVRRDGQMTKAETELLDEAQLRLTQANRWAEGILVEQSLVHGQPVNVRRRFYPLQWLRGIQPLLNSLAIQHGVKLAWVGWDRSLPRLYLDANHLSRAVLNLASNAIQASRPGSQIRIEVAWQTHVTQRLIITIDDQGRGLPAGLLQQINSLTAVSHEKSLESCAGVGLRTATTLIAALGGSITAQNKPTGGTRLRAMLPVDNYHSLIHSWLQQNGVGAPSQIARSGSRITINALRSSAGENAASKWQTIDARLQQAASSNEFVYRVAADRWLWLSLQSTTSPEKFPHSLSEVLRELRERDNAWNRPLDCRHQQVFQWQSVANDRRGRSPRDHSYLMSLTSKLAEKLAEFVGEHVPPLDELQRSDAPIVIRPQSGGPARLIRSDRAQATRPAAHGGQQLASAPAKGVVKGSVAGTSLADTPCESFSGSLAELTQIWHARQQQLDQTSLALGRRKI